MSPSGLFGVHPARVAERQILHYPGQRIFRDLDSQVYGVRHAAKTVDPMAISFHPLLDQSIQVIPIFVIRENVLPAISA
jgi:hypothetical protein